MQATARAEGHGIAAKGLTGHGYEGHYFWDTEIYVFPFLMHTSPRVARQVLDYRCGMLDAARARARELGHRGALYPWRTINGEEASAWYAAGTAQYHINADIAYAMRQYARVTGDLGLPARRRRRDAGGDGAAAGCELGFFSERRDGRFCINGVTGPDEYTTVVDNNAYTNLMAKENLRAPCASCEWLRARTRRPTRELVAPPASPTTEIDGWLPRGRRACTSRATSGSDRARRTTASSSTSAGTSRARREKYPLLLHYHPLELYRHQVIKQADVVLATYLVEHQFSEEETRRTFDYYDPLTTGDSSLSACIQSIVASAVGYPEAALRLLQAGRARSTWPTPTATPHDGIHIASAAAPGWRSSPASAACATSTATCASRRGCRPSGSACASASRCAGRSSRST